MAKTQDMQRIQREAWGETTTEFGDTVLRQASDVVKSDDPKAAFDFLMLAQNLLQAAMSWC